MSKMVVWETPNPVALDIYDMTHVGVVQPGGHAIWC